MSNRYLPSRALVPVVSIGLTSCCGYAGKQNEVQRICSCPTLNDTGSKDYSVPLSSLLQRRQKANSAQSSTTIHTRYVFRGASSDGVKNKAQKHTPAMMYFNTCFISSWINWFDLLFYSHVLAVPQYVGGIAVPSSVLLLGGLGGSNLATLHKPHQTSTSAYNICGRCLAEWLVCHRQ